VINRSTPLSGFGGHKFRPEPEQTLISTALIEALVTDNDEEVEDCLDRRGQYRLLQHRLSYQKNAHAASSICISLIVH
jgi:hypothetical protein